jgi:hypothetical protein
MDEPLIRDIPSIKKNVEGIRNITTLKRAMPFLRPFLKLLGADVGQIDDALANADELSHQAEELATIPDRFNDLFAPRGWIIYDLMNLEVAKAVIQKAESGDLDGAEVDLVNYYSVETVRWQLRTMNAITAFRPRMPLAQKALTDYEEERYHACVPVVLALLDGLVNELHEKRRGFFAEEVDLTAWDSIAAHSRGLNVLTGILQKGRYKTTTEQITIPYRHGIMHGIDLGYDNKIVAAKTWAALFATRDWALKAERGLLTAPPEEPQKTWADIFHQLRENATDKERLQQWKPRNIKVSVDTPITGEPDSFDDGTPEKKLAEYLTFWKLSNYGYMAKCLSPKLGPPVKRAPAYVREVFESKNLKSFAFTEISDDAAAVTEIQTDLVFEEYGREVKKSVRFRLVNMDSEGNPAVRGKTGSDWAVVNWPVY